MDTSIPAGYPYSGYPYEYGSDTGILFIQQDRDEYHTIRTHRYSLTSLLQTVLFHLYIEKYKKKVFIF